jgi:hypothetical protein
MSEWIDRLDKAIEKAYWPFITIAATYFGVHIAVWLW